jgi:four helix bundle protein
MSKTEFADEFKQRTKIFSLRVLKLFKNLPRTPDAQIMGNQLFRSASSVAANYRAVCRARSNAEFFTKLSIVVEEADETVYWLEMLMDGGIVPKDRLADLLKEANEILSIVAKSRKTAKTNQQFNNSKNQ